MGFVLLAVPVIAVILFLFISGKKFLHAVSIAASSIQIITAVFITRQVAEQGQIAYPALGGLFYLDALSIIILDIVLVIALLVSIYSMGYLEEELKHGKIEPGRLRIYYLLMYSFIFTMVLALTVKNMGILWIAIEATTLASTFLVGFYNDKHALEAAWKYVIICSVGIAFALLGIMFLHLSSVNILATDRFLDWTALYQQAPALNSSTLRLAFIFILLGFGTKAGLAPMHTWLPDAHSQAPSPISALLSGVLLNSAMYGIIRTVAIVNRNLASSQFTGTLLIATGILSITAAAIFIISQKDYKRLLAYSSIEHMGIIALAMGIFSPLSVFGALLHMINHSLTKSMLFLASGSILQKYGTKDIVKIKGLLKLLPVSGTAFLLGLFAIAGTPPFSIFTSEFNIIAAIFQTDHFILGTAVVFLLAAVFVGIAMNLLSIFYGQQGGGDEAASIPAGEPNLPGALTMAILLIAIAVSGLVMPESFTALIWSAQSIIMGG